MGAQNFTGTKTQFFKLKEDKKTKTINFYKQEKVNGAWGLTDSFNTISGFITGIKTKEFEWEGKKGESITISLKDDSSDELISIDMGFSSTAVDILNKIAGTEILDVVKFQCGVNKGGYPTVWMNNNGEKMSWKYTPSDIPKVEKVINPKTGKEIGFDSSERDEFIKKMINEDIAPKLGGENKKWADSGSKVAETAGAKLEPDSDLPF